MQKHYLNKVHNVPYVGYEYYYTHTLSPIVAGDIGGSMGLFVGASVITVFELIDAMLHNFLKVQLQETKQRRRSIAIARTKSQREAQADSKKSKDSSANHK